MADAGEGRGLAHALDDVVGRQARGLVDQEEEAAPQGLGFGQGSSFRRRQDLREQLLDARAALEREVGDEVELGRVAQAAAPADLAPQVSGRARETLGRALPLRLAAEDGEVDARGLQVRRHLDAGHGHALDRGVVRLDQEEARQLLPHEVGDALAAAGFFLHDGREP